MALLINQSKSDTGKEELYNHEEEPLNGTKNQKERNEDSKGKPTRAEELLRGTKTTKRKQDSKGALQRA